MSLLRFFFTDRFTRFDVFVIVVACCLYFTERVGFVGFFLLAVAGFGLGAIGEALLSTRTNGGDHA